MFDELMQKRRSMRKYLDRSIEPEKINSLLEAALRAPSVKSIYPVEFIVVDDRGMLEKLSVAKPAGAAFLKGAALGIVVCANQDKSDTCIEDASIASIVIQLAAESLGLGSCWIQLRNRTRADGRPSQQYVSELLDIPANYMVQAVMAIGYPAETKAPRNKETLKFEHVHKGRFGTKMESR
jgi:nitroreductase